MSTKVITGKVRFSYAHVFEPSAVSEDQEIVEINFNANDMKSLCNALNNSDVIED